MQHSGPRGKKWSDSSRYSCSHGEQSFFQTCVWHLISLKSGTHKNKAFAQDVSAHNINCGTDNDVRVCLRVCVHARVCLLCIHKAVAPHALDPSANSGAAWAVCVDVNMRQIARKSLVEDFPP